jgi:hypothetical protein
MDEKYRTKDDVMAAIFLSLGVKFLGTQIDKSKRKVYFVFDLDNARGKALEVLIRSKDPRIKVCAGAIHHAVEFMRSWLYLTRLNLSDSSVEKVEAQIGDNFSHLMDDSEPTTIKDIADEIEKVVAEYNRQEGI